MTTWYKAMVVSVALMSLGGLSACGDDDGETVDAGTDAGRDGGMEDTGPPPDVPCVPNCEGRECGSDGCGGFCGAAGDGTCPGGLTCNDGTCPRTVFTRIAHLIPNAANIDLCLYTTAGGTTTVTGPLIELNSVPDGMPFRGVSSYVPLVQSVAGVEYVVKVFLETDVPDAETCPALDATDPAPILEHTIAGDELAVGGYYTIAAVGFVDEGGTDPSYCGIPGTFGMPCSAVNQQPHFEVFTDDVTLDDEAQTGVRFLHTIPNLGQIDVCWDADGDETASDPVELFADVTYLEAVPYLETAPMTTGTITLHMDIAGATDGMTCHQVPTGATTTTRIAVIPLPWPFPDTDGDTMPDVPSGAVTDFPAGQAATIIFSGNAATPTMPATAPAPIPWEDAPVSI